MGNFLSGAGRQSQVDASGEHVVGSIVAPADIDPRIADLFTSVVGDLPPGRAKAEDVRLIVQLCEALHVQSECWKRIITDGVITVDNAHGGEMRRHPAVITWRQAADAARQCMNLLGMSPAARARIQTPDGTDYDPFEDYLRRGPTSTPQGK